MTAHIPDLQRQAWEQLLRLLSGQSWQFRPEHWPYLRILADWHHIVLELYQELSRHTDRHPFNQQQLELLHGAVLAERKNLLLLTELQNQVHSQLKARGIRALFFKGVLVGQWLYGSNLARQCRDIDLIVHPDDHEPAFQALQQIDCFRLIPAEGLSAFALARYRAAMKDFSLVHRPSGGLIELHWSLRPFRQAFDFDFDTAWGKRTDISIDGHAIPAFDNATHIRYLATHGCNSHWGRLCWLLDWRQICQLDPDWQGLIEDCANDREKAHLKQAFALANRQLGMAIPAAIDALPDPRLGNYSIRTQTRSQMQGQYPGWFARQLLQLACQHDLPGRLGYLMHMGKKALAADTLRPKTRV
ncbi:MAG: nucleotidyltransferase family protein [Porticoccaceae bacterium]